MLASEILGVPVDRPERLFSGDADADLKLFRKLQAEWHPDRHGGSAEATEAFQRVNALWNARNDRLIHNKQEWRGGGTCSLELPGQQALAIHFVRRRTFELGTQYICRNTLIYTSDGTALSKKLFAQALQTINVLRYADDRMRKEFARYLPVVKSYLPDTRPGPTLVLEKTSELIALRDLLEFADGKLDGKHVAWILSCLHNLLCYLQWAGLTHNAIDLDTYFISPEHHAGVLLGGWWYACQRKATLQHLPARSAELWFSLPSSITKLKQARHRLDRESIRCIGRELLGDSGGTKLLHDPSVPGPLARWVSLPSGKDALSDYKQWERVRESIGKRAFTKLEVTAEQVYE